MQARPRHQRRGRTDAAGSAAAGPGSGRRCLELIELVHVLAVTTTEILEPGEAGLVRLAIARIAVS